MPSSEGKLRKAQNVGHAVDAAHFAVEASDFLLVDEDEFQNKIGISLCRTFERSFEAHPLALFEGVCIEIKLIHRPSIPP